MTDPNESDPTRPIPGGGDQPWPPPPPPPAQPGWGGQPPAPGYGYGHYEPPPPTHPQAATVLTLGLIGLVGGMMCFLPLLLSPVAWVMGARAKREIEAEPMRWSGRDQVTAGHVLGIVGTAILALGVIAMIGFIAFLALSETA